MKTLKKDAPTDSVKRDRQVVEQVHAAPCSIELNRDAKGEPRWAIKAYCEADGLETCADEVLRIDRYLADKLKPAPGEAGGGD